MGKREKQICMNHVETVIFESKHDKCPVCKESLWTFTYSGERECNYNLNGSAKTGNTALPPTTQDSPTSQPQNRDNPQNSPETSSCEERTGAENVACRNCGSVDKPIHHNRLCPDCYHAAGAPARRVERGSTTPGCTSKDGAGASRGRRPGCTSKGATVLVDDHDDAWQTTSG